MYEVGLDDLLSVTDQLSSTQSRLLPSLTNADFLDYDEYVGPQRGGVLPPTLFQDSLFPGGLNFALGFMVGIGAKDPLGEVEPTLLAVRYELDRCEIERGFVRDYQLARMEYSHGREVDTYERIINANERTIGFMSEISGLIKRNVARTIGHLAEENYLLLSLAAHWKQKHDTLEQTVGGKLIWAFVFGGASIFMVNFVGDVYGVVKSLKTEVSQYSVDIDGDGQADIITYTEVWKGTRFQENRWSLQLCTNQDDGRLHCTYEYNPNQYAAQMNEVIFGKSK